jgi:hypothetical protein
MWSIICSLALAIYAANSPLATAVTLHSHAGRNITNYTSDSDFYGLSPPVYPTRKSFQRRRIYLSANNPSSSIAPTTGSGGWAAAFEKAQALVGQMTLEEKVNITYGWSSPTNACVGNTGSVPRLGWPGMCLQDAGNGVRIVDFANAYPAGLHVGASWDSALAYQRGQMMGQEFRTKGGLFENNFDQICFADSSCTSQCCLGTGCSAARSDGSWREELGGIYSRSLSLWCSYSSNCLWDPGLWCHYFIEGPYQISETQLA